MRDCRHRDRPQLTEEFVQAVRASGLRLVVLAGLVGYPSHAALCTALTQRSISSTPLGRVRMLRVAEIVGYTGELFIGKAS